MPIVYDSGNPDRAKIDKIEHLYTLPILIILCAIVATAVALSESPEIKALIQDFFNG